MKHWIEVPIEQQKWQWVEYSLTVRCTCGKDVDVWDGDVVSDGDDVFLCECGRRYSMCLVYREREEH